MASKYRINLRSVENVAASKTAIITPPANLRLHAVVLHHGYASGTNTIAATASNITEIRVKVGTKVQRRISGTQLRDLLLLNGTAYDFTGVPNTAPGVSIPIFFAEPWRRSVRQGDILAWDPSVLQAPITIEVDLGAASTPTLIAYAIASPDLGAGLIKGQWPGMITWESLNFGANGVDFTYSKISPKGNFLRLSLYEDSGGSNILTPVSLILDNDIKHDLTQTQNLAALNANGLTPAASGRTANMYDLVADLDDQITSAINLNGVKEVDVRIQAGSAMSGTISAILQRLGGLL